MHVFRALDIDIASLQSCRAGPAVCRCSATAALTNHECVAGRQARDGSQARVASGKGLYICDRQHKGEQHHLLQEAMLRCPAHAQPVPSLPTKQVCAEKTRCTLLVGTLT